MRTCFLRGPVTAAALAVASGLLAACSTAPAPPARPPSAGRSPASHPSTILAPAYGLVPADRGLTDRLVLQQTRVTAGTPISGRLVVINASHAPST